MANPPTGLLVLAGAGEQRNAQEGRRVHSDPSPGVVFWRHGRQVIDECPEEAVKPRRGAEFSITGFYAQVGAKTGKLPNDMPGVPEPGWH